ncbi:Hypothetical protein NTJ_09523 [Nesidiocoris tenuis]|uniref:Uncharacterized protein n=1 Tax=Nesidiocoris tenuis TaxID=355587 RepID=A0ABN7AWZ3_9HEMI|nr:Hypothetical protein NTJ_09523 [Nesidiocoris tenuis]
MRLEMEPGGGLCTPDAALFRRRAGKGTRRKRCCPVAGSAPLCANLGCPVGHNRSAIQDGCPRILHPPPGHEPFALPALRPLPSTLSPPDSAAADFIDCLRCAITVTPTHYIGLPMQRKFLHSPSSLFRVDS